MKRLTILALLIITLLSCTTKKEYVTQVIGPSDWQPPVLTWLTPPDSPLRGTVGLDVSVTDSSHVDSVTLFVDGRESATVVARPYRFEIHSDSLTEGVHICEARAWDQFGNLGISPVLRVFAANGTVEGIRLLRVPDDYPTIQAAINAATDFDTIRVKDGTYYETLNTFGKGVWIESEHGPLTCTVNAAGARSCFYVPASRARATIRGFRLTGGYYQVYLQNGSRGSLFNNVLYSDTAHSLLVTGDGGGDMRNNLFDGSGTALQIQNFWGTLQNNIIEHAREFGFWNASLDRNPLQYGYDSFWNNGQDYAGFDPGFGDINADPLIDMNAGRLLPGSPAIDAGNPSILDKDGSRSDIGPFGGPYAY